MLEETNLEALEEAIGNLEQVDEFNENLSFDNFIVVSKKDISNFCRIVEPLTKQAVDDYGKCIYFHCVNSETVQLGYQNTPYVVQADIINKSGKTVKDFAVSVTTLKKLAVQAFASLVLVEQNDEINIALCESLLYLETKPLSAEQYNFNRKSTNKVIDKEGALYVFKKLGSSLALTERASEKVVTVTNGKVHFNTGIFTAINNSPFSPDESFVIYKQIAEIISVFAELSQTGVNYTIEDETLILSTSGFYAELQVGTEDKVKEFLSPLVETSLKFDANIQIVNDNLFRIVSVVGGLEYLSDIVKLEFTKEELNLYISNQTQSRTSKYTFPIFEGTPEVIGEMKITIPVLKLFLGIAGTDCRYAFNEAGLGLQTPTGKFLIRKS